MRHLLLGKKGNFSKTNYSNFRWDTKNPHKQVNMHKLGTEELNSMYLQEDLVTQLGPEDLFHLFVLEDLQDLEDLLDLLHPRIPHEKTIGDYFTLKSRSYKVTQEQY